MVLMELAMAFARLPRLARRRCWHATGTTFPNEPPRRRYRRLLARGGYRTRASPSTRCGNEAARPGVARVRGSGRWIVIDDPADGDLRSRGVARPCVLVPAVSLPRAGVRWNAEGDRAGSGSA